MQIGIQCSRGQIPWEECRRCRLDPLHPCHYTPDILAMIERKSTTDHPKATAYTPSRMCGCDRQVILLGHGDYYENYSGAWPLVRGTLVHSILEANREPVEGYARCLREIRLSVQLPGSSVPPAQIEQDFDARDAQWEPGQEPFTGKPDLLLLRELELPAFPGAPAVQSVKIIDYKTSQIDHDLIAAKPAHQMQMNMYAWLVRHALPAYLGENIVIVIEEMEIIYLGYNKTRRFTSAGPLKDRGKKPRGATEYEELTLAPIKLLPDAVVEAWIRKRIQEKQAASMEHLPPVLGPDEDWMCRLCPVRERCFALARDEEGSTP